MTATVQQLPPNQQNVDLPPLMDDHISPEQLARNAAAYPEMSWEVDESLLANARQRLLQLPLVHRTSAPRFGSQPVEQPWLYDTPVPFSYLPSEIGDQHGNTLRLDEDLDLDEFVFMSWGGVFDRTANFLAGKRYAVLIDPRILLDSRCVATPDDISDLVDVEETLEGLDSEDQAVVREEYINKMVSGRDWLEIMARRMAKSMAEGKTLPTIKASTLGEIKFHGQIPASAIIASLDTHSGTEYKLFRKHVKELTGFRLPIVLWPDRVWNK